MIGRTIERNSQSYLVEYDHPENFQAFYGATRDEAIAHAKAYDPESWGIFSTVWEWNGDCYQRA